jgi:hypothetical protein
VEASSSAYRFFLAQARAWKARRENIRRWARKDLATATDLASYKYVSPVSFRVNHQRSELRRKSGVRHLPHLFPPSFLSRAFSHFPQFGCAAAAIGLELVPLSPKLHRSIRKQVSSLDLSTTSTTAPISPSSSVLPCHRVAPVVESSLPSSPLARHSRPRSHLLHTLHTRNHTTHTPRTPKCVA